MTPWNLKEKLFTYSDKQNETINSFEDQYYMWCYMAQIRESFEFQMYRLDCLYYLYENKKKPEYETYLK